MPFYFPKNGLKVDHRLSFLILESLTMTLAPWLSDVWVFHWTPYTGAEILKVLL